MEEYQQNNVVSPDMEESEIDFKEIALRLWAKRKFIIWVVCAFTVLGLAAALLQKPVYTASCTFVPQSSSSKGSSSLSSLAAMAGINLGDMSSSESLSPVVYPQLLQNVDFNKELMNLPFNFRKYQEPVSYYDLMTDPKYKKFNLIGTIKKYTIGLPGVIMKAIRGEQPDVAAPSSAAGNVISSYTKKEYEVAKVLSKRLSLAVEKKDGYLTLSATTGEALNSAELCQAAFDLMQKYVADFKLQHARQSLDFINDRYQESKKDYEEKQLALAKFTDANRGVLTATAQIRKDQLMSDYTLASNLFNEMSKQLLQAEMKVKEDTPVLSPVKPVSVPMQKTNSRAKTLFVWIFLGVIAACGAVLGFDWLRKQGVNWPKNWE